MKYDFSISIKFVSLHGILLKRAFHGTKNFLPTLRWIYLSHHYVDAEKLVQQYYIIVIQGEWTINTKA
jgi:hypothetical protein